MENEEDIRSGKSDKVQKRATYHFIMVLILFTLGMSVLLICSIGIWYFWYIYLLAWIIIQVEIAKNIKLKWWWWLLIVALIIIFEFLVFVFV